MWWVSLADSSGQTRPHLAMGAELLPAWFPSGQLPFVLLTCAACLLYDAGAVVDATTGPVPFDEEHLEPRTRPEFTTILEEEERGVTFPNGTRRRKVSVPTTTLPNTSSGNTRRKTRPGPVQNKRKERKKGRGKKKKDMMRMMMAIKMVLVSILVPKVIGLALFASWKGITISLIAFTIAAIAIKWSATTQESRKSIQLLIKKQDDGGGNHHHEHWWRKIREAEPVYYEEEPHHQSPYHGWIDD